MQTFRPKLPKAKPVPRRTLERFLHGRGFRDIHLAGKSNRRLEQMARRFGWKNPADTKAMSRRQAARHLS
jgi:hypothetical protein